MLDSATILCLGVLLLPLASSLFVGLLRESITLQGAHLLTAGSVFVSFLLSCTAAKMVFADGYSGNTNLYSWADGGELFPFNFHMGFMIDELTIVMLLVVSIISFLVHVYSIGYMHKDPGYKRFFSYISFFTFAMYLLVLANNFLQLFIGWEAVGVASYLLIGFWFKKDSATAGGLKAFLVNRVSDFGFIIGISLIFYYTSSLDYLKVFDSMILLQENSINFGFLDMDVLTVICLLLFWGAMGKSAQMPLHVWLPESMEGPTPISALIHAATMVTAGVFMLARMSPLFEHSDVALSFIMIIGATGALLLGLVALVMNDIKKIVAYSTLSQLGYMMVAMGASCYPIGIFHLVTHAFFKALLFLGAGSVILALHHEQDIRKMGGLKKYMPITYWTCLLGSLALVAVPPFAGFYSKDMIIQAAKNASVFGSGYAYICILLGALVTSIYTFRAFLLTFHGKPREDYNDIKEPGYVITMPLMILAIFSVVIGAVLYEPVVHSNVLLKKSIFIDSMHTSMQIIRTNSHGVFAMILHAITTAVFWLTILGIAIAYLFYVRAPWLTDILANRFNILQRILLKKYWFDIINEYVFVRGFKYCGRIFTKTIDNLLIDNTMVDGTGKMARLLGILTRKLQTGSINHYLIMMLLGTLVFIVLVIIG